MLRMLPTNSGDVTTHTGVIVLKVNM